MNKLNLEEKKQLVFDLGIEIFDYLTALPQDVRPDPEGRVGIAILLRILSTRELLEVFIKNPSPFARFLAAEKSARTEAHAHKTSQDSEDIPNLKFAGCIGFYLESTNEELHVSISGFKGGPEDAVVAIIIASRVVGVSVDAIIDDIKKDGGTLPEEIFQEGHFLNVLLNKYR